MPSAAPVPRGPSVMLLGSATGLLDRAGCPACRYVAETTEAYLARFALDGHYDRDVMSRLCSSRGMCAPHTRRLLGQPGAPTRLTAVYLSILDAVAGALCVRPARCPACEHVAAATDRVLDILIDDVMARDRAAYQQHGGLCLPHLRYLANQRKKTDLLWPTRLMVARLTSESVNLDLLTGWPDSDASARSTYRAALPSRRPLDGRTCSACWAAADAELRLLADVDVASRNWPASFPDQCLCEQHVRDLALTAGGRGTAVAAWQAERQARQLAQVEAGRPRRLGYASGKLSARARRAFADPACPVCRRRDSVGSRELASVAVMLAGPKCPPGELALCVRHVASLHAIDSAAGLAAAAAMSHYAAGLRAELAEAFTNQTWAQRHEPGTGATRAWRRAAAFLDGAVLGGCPA